MNVELTAGFMRRLLGLDKPTLDLTQDEYCLRVSFKPAWMRPKVRVVFEVISVKDPNLIAGRIESPPMAGDETLTLIDIKSIFNVEIRT